AELRAAGSSWDAAARKLHTTPDALRDAVAAHRRQYRRLFAAARREVLDESFCEGLFTLRRQVRSDDERIANRAADALVRARLALFRHRTKGPPGPTREPLSSENEELVRFLDSHTDEQLAALARNLFGDDTAGGNAVLRTPVDPAGPAGGEVSLASAGSFAGSGE